MIMQSRRLVSKAIGQIDDKLIFEVDMDLRRRPLPVDADHRSAIAIGRGLCRTQSDQLLGRQDIKLTQTHVTFQSRVTTAAFTARAFNTRRTIEGRIFEQFCNDSKG